MSWMKRCLGLLLAGLACLASAQIPGLSQAARVTDEVNTPQVRARLVAYAPQGVQAGQPLWLGLALAHQPEWHTYWGNRVTRACRPNWSGNCPRA